MFKYSNHMQYEANGYIYVCSYGTPFAEKIRKLRDDVYCCTTPSKSYTTSYIFARRRLNLTRHRQNVTRRRLFYTAASKSYKTSYKSYKTLSKGLTRRFLSAVRRMLCACANYLAGGIRQSASSSIKANFLFLSPKQTPLSLTVVAYGVAQAGQKQASFPTRATAG